jgi:putative ABC transport system permease protein
MKALRFAFKALWSRKVSSLFIGLIWAMGLLGLATTQRLERGMEAQLVRTLEGSDIMLCAKGSPTQAILANIFHIDQATGNIPTDEAEKWLSHPDILHVRRLAYGDSYRGSRILGCDSATWLHIPAFELEGRWPEMAMEVVVGSHVAEKHGVEIGDEFHGSHGTVEDLGDHAEHHYHVVGIVQSPELHWNELVLTPLESVWAVHEEEARNYTAVLARIDQAMTRLMLPGQIQRNSPLMAVSPAMEANRMVGWMNQGGQVIEAMAWLLTAIAFLSMVLLLHSHIRERLPEYALLRAMGGTWGQIAALVLGQNFVLALLAVSLTYLGLAMAFWSQGAWLPPGLLLLASDWWNLQFDLFWWALTLFLALFAGIGPWVWLQKIPLHRALVDH